MCGDSIPTTRNLGFLKRETEKSDWLAGRCRDCGSLERCSSSCTGERCEGLMRLVMVVVVQREERQKMISNQRTRLIDRERGFLAIVTRRAHAAVYGHGYVGRSAASG
uniref:Uncharacterized protein n=1 Tax=Sipha flava TaxID=143950 RepID=A0A2S2QL92_9HEMI